MRGSYPLGYNGLTQVVAERKAAREANISFAELPAATYAELTGSHPNPGLHEKPADRRGKIAETTDWS